MAEEGLAGCCGNVMLPAGGAAADVGGAVITAPGSGVLKALRERQFYNVLEHQDSSIMLIKVYFALAVF